MRHEGYKPFQPQGVLIPLEKVGIRGSERRPGERRLNLVRPTEPEQPKTLLQEMQQYITRRQQLRDIGYFAAMGKEPANINLADATHNDLDAILHVSPLPDNSQDVMTKGNTVRMENVFVAYGMSKFSPEKKREVLASWEEIERISRQSVKRVNVLELTPAETETVQWLLAHIGVPFNAPPEGFKESSTSLLFRMRTSVAQHQPQWEQEQKAQERVYRLTRRR